MRLKSVIAVLFGAALLAAAVQLRAALSLQSSSDMRIVAARVDRIEDVISSVGTIKPFEEVEVGAQVSGQLKEMKVKLGGRVEAGQILATIDPLLLQAGVAANEAQLKGLRALLEQRAASITLMERRLQRQEILLAKKATSEDAFETSQANARNALGEARQIEAIDAER